MLSRIADSLFWLNRYMERADGLLRIASTNYILSLDRGITTNLTWRPVLEIFTYANGQQVAALENDTTGTLRMLLTDTENPNSLKVILNRARENARGVQDHITKEVWEQVNYMYHLINRKEIAAKLDGYEAIEVIDELSRNCLLFTGVTDITMPRGAGWNFMNLGRFIERCTQTIELTDSQYRSKAYNLHSEADILEWRSLLLSLSGYELHLKTYSTADFNKDVLHQVLVNTNFPHSVIYSLSRIGKYLDDVLLENRLEGNAALQRYFGSLYSRVKYVDFETLNGVTLQEFLTGVRHDLLEFSRRLAQHYFSYS